MAPQAVRMTTQTHTKHFKQTQHGRDMLHSHTWDFPLSHFLQHLSRLTFLSSSLQTVGDPSGHH